MRPAGYETKPGIVDGEQRRVVVRHGVDDGCARPDERVANRESAVRPLVPRVREADPDLATRLVEQAVVAPHDGKRERHARDTNPCRLARVTSPATVPAPRGPRLRELGLRIGIYETGPLNAITDVPGVLVGHATVWRDEPDPPAGRGVGRSGVTAIVPADPATLVSRPIPAGTDVLNGAGELTSSIAIREWGVIETPVYLTATMSVGRVYDGAVRAAIAADPRIGVEHFVIPVVGECDDGWLSEARVVQVELDDVAAALASADGGLPAEGAVGAGTGMMTFDFKAGIGTASRVLPAHEATLGVLVLSNFGVLRDLVVAGVPVGELLGGAAARAGAATAAASLW